MTERNSGSRAEARAQFPLPLAGGGQGEGYERSLSDSQIASSTLSVSRRTWMFVKRSSRMPRRRMNSLRRRSCRCCASVQWWPPSISIASRARTQRKSTIYGPRVLPPELETREPLVPHQRPYEPLGVRRVAPQGASELEKPRIKAMNESQAGPSVRAAQCCCTLP